MHGAVPEMSGPGQNGREVVGQETRAEQDSNMVGIL